MRQDTQRDRQDRETVRLKSGERVDELERNGYRIIQNPKKFCFGMDAVLLTGFARARESDRLLDLGTMTRQTHRPTAIPKSQR